MADHQPFRRGRGSAGLAVVRSVQELARGARLRQVIGRHDLDRRRGNGKVRQGILRGHDDLPGAAHIQPQVVVEHRRDPAAAKEPDVVFVKIVRDEQRCRAAAFGECVEDRGIPPPIE